MISGQALETMNKLKEINEHVKLALDKLQVIRADLVSLDDNWQKWDLAKLVDSLRTWTDRNPQDILNNDQNIKGKLFFKQKSKNKPLMHVLTVINKIIMLVSVSQ